MAHFKTHSSTPKIDLLLANGSDLAMCLRFIHLRLSTQRNYLVHLDNINLPMIESSNFRRVTSGTHNLIVPCARETISVLRPGISYLLIAGHCPVVTNDQLILEDKGLNSPLWMKHVAHLVASKAISLGELILLSTLRDEMSLNTLKEEADFTWIETLDSSCIKETPTSSTLTRPLMIQKLCKDFRQAAGLSTTNRPAHLDQTHPERTDSIRFLRQSEQTLAGLSIRSKPKQLIPSSHATETLGGKKNLFIENLLRHKKNPMTQSGPEPSKGDEPVMGTNPSPELYSLDSDFHCSNMPRAILTNTFEPICLNQNFRAYIRRELSGKIINEADNFVMDNFFNVPQLSRLKIHYNRVKGSKHSMTLYLSPSLLAKISRLNDQHIMLSLEYLIYSDATPNKKRKTPVPEGC